MEKLIIYKSAYQSEEERNDAYIKLVQEDLNWLEKQDHSLEKSIIKKKNENYIIDMIVNDAMQIHKESLYLIGPGRA